MIEIEIKKERHMKKMNFTSGSLTCVAPRRVMIDCVQRGMNHRTIRVTITNSNSQKL